MSDRRAEQKYWFCHYCDRPGDGIRCDNCGANKWKGRGSESYMALTREMLDFAQELSVENKKVLKQVDKKIGGSWLLTTAWVVILLVFTGVSLWLTWTGNSFAAAIGIGAVVMWVGFSQYSDETA